MTEELLFPECGDCSPNELLETVKEETTAKDDPFEGLSRKARNRLKARERYLEHKKTKRVEEKERKKAKRKLLREAGDVVALKKKKAKKMAESTCKLRIAVDMSFDHLMSDKDRGRAVKQLGWCYTVNRHAPEPLQFFVTSFEGPSREIYKSLESNLNRDIYLKEQALEEVFEKSDIVYLTAESDNVLTDLDDSKVYVIGGLVDHNSHKGLCHRIAVEKGYAHARLPIDEFVKLKTRKVLTINHVYEILVRYMDGHNWEEAFFAVMPQRKGMEKKEDGDSKSADSEGPENEGDEEDEVLPVVE